MRILILVVLTLAGAGYVGWLVYRFLPRPSAAARAQHQDTNRDRISIEMARLIEAGLNDPTYRVSDEWESKAQSVIADWYR